MLGRYLRPQQTNTFKRKTIIPILYRYYWEITFGQAYYYGIYTYFLKYYSGHNLFVSEDKS